VPSHAASIGYAALHGVARGNAILFRALGNSPRDAIGLLVALLAAGTIVINALYLQPGPHPAPIFSVKPRPVAEPVAVTPRPRPDLPAKTAPTPAVAAPRVEPVPMPAPRAAVRDPIAELIAPTPRVTAVQRALNDYGYGPVKATGVYGPETVAAIEKFERDRKLPVTGQISPRLMKELGAVTGRPLE
jgi:hypothetical protein